MSYTVQGAEIDSIDTIKIEGAPLLFAHPVDFQNADRNKSVFTGMLKVLLICHRKQRFVLKI